MQNSLFVTFVTNNINTAVSSAATQAGASNVTSYIAGQAAETTADMILSLGTDYAIAQGQSLITTGEFMDSSEYWSLDRFLGEGKNQLIGILTGLSSSKINNYQQGIIASAEKAGVEYYVVEQDQCPGDQFESVAKSSEYIHQNFMI